MDGIRVHADVASVNLNFWVTPDDANLDPSSGGLVVYPRVPPEDVKPEGAGLRPKVKRSMRFFSPRVCSPTPPFFPCKWGSTRLMP